MQTVFVYGTLIDPDIMHRVCARTLPQSESATLPGYRRLALRERCYPGIIPDADAQCPGVCYRGVSEYMLERLDAYEGAEYQRQRCEIINASGSRESAWCYCLTPQAQALVTEQAWDYERFRAEHAARFIQEACS